MEPIVVESVSTKEKIKDFSNFHYSKHMPIFLILGIVIIALGIIYIISYPTYFNGYLLCLLGAFLCFYGNLFAYINVKINAKSIGVNEKFEFFEDKLIYTQTKDGVEILRNEVCYNALSSIKQSKKYVLVYINKTNAHLFEKSLLSESQLNYIFSSINNCLDKEKQK